MAVLTTSVATNIRKIAKTDELTEKVDRLIQESKEPVKADLETQRRRAYVDSTGSTSIGTGAAAGAKVTVGTAADGTPVVGPVAPPFITGQQNTSNSATDAARDALKNNNTNSQNNTNNDTNSTDMTDSTHQTLNGGGGSVFADQAQLGANNADWQAIQNAMITNGATEEQIAQARIAFLGKELGIDEVGDVFTGKTGAQPADLSNAYNGQSTNTQGANATPTQTQRGFVGVDPTDDSKSLLLRMDGWQPTPSDTDATAGGQNSWADGTPVKAGWELWELGYYWHASGIPAPTVQDSPYPAGAVQNYMDYLTSLGLDTYHYENLVVDIIGRTATYDIVYIDHTTGDPVPSGTGTAAGHACDIGHASVCPAQAEYETSWPLTGVGVLSWLDGTFVKSIYDSEAPLKYTSAPSSADIKSLSTGETYQVDPAINGGYMLSQKTDTPYVMVYGSNGQLVNIVPPSLKIFYTPR